MVVFICKFQQKNKTYRSRWINFNLKKSTFINSHSTLTHPDIHLRREIDICSSDTYPRMNKGLNWISIFCLKKKKNTFISNTFPMLVEKVSYAVDKTVLLMIFIVFLVYQSFCQYKNKRSFFFFPVTNQLYALYI